MAITTARTLDEVRERVTDDDTSKWDEIVPAKEITLHQGRLWFPQATSQGFDTGLSLSPWATQQACNRLGIPTGYFNKCPSHLKDEQFNWWRAHREAGREEEPNDRDDRWLVRSKGGTARGILSPRYSKLDNRQLVEALLPVLAGTRYQVRLLDLSSEAFHLRLVDPAISRDVLPGDRLQVGIHLANSEVGLRAVTVDALVYRVICTNGLVRRIAGKSLLRQRHVYVASARFEQMLEEALREAVLVAAAFLEQMALTIKVPIPNPLTAVATLGEIWQLPQSVQDNIVFRLLGEQPTDTLYALVNAITATAQQYGMEERFQLETLASVLVETNPNGQENSIRQRILASRN